MKRMFKSTAITSSCGLALFLSSCFAVIADAATSNGAATNIQLTDKGFVPSRVYAGVNQSTSFHIVNRGSKAHEFSIPYYYIFTRTLNPGEETTVSFTPSTSGRFEMMSDPEGTNQPEYKGEFIVTADK